jgi:hypothetical protein
LEGETQRKVRAGDDRQPAIAHSDAESTTCEGVTGEKRRERKRIYLRDAEDTRRKSKPEGTEEAEIAP